MKIQLLYCTEENTEVRELEQRGLSEAKAWEGSLACVTEQLPLYHYQHRGHRMLMRRKKQYLWEQMLHVDYKGTFL